MSQYPGRTSQLVPVDPQHAGFAQGHSQPYPSYHAGDSNHTTVPHGQYHGFPPAMHAPAYHSDMPPPPPATRSQLWQVPPGQTGHELGYPTTPIDYPPQPTQPVHAGNSYGHASTPSLSRSHSMTQMPGSVDGPPAGDECALQLAGDLEFVRAASAAHARRPAAAPARTRIWWSWSLIGYLCALPSVLAPSRIAVYAFLLLVMLSDCLHL
ncbi:uncharacterized protein B0H18DRAFT_150253 [Fomitopsis serialis]|uniref:uncharacterized protein n=1 Tax=Fomitopsis serialis TaxID=139415 RepID=UPI0020079CF9|nr:uncharacterized protein B0H18DRAFT_150253 [Neoantrodia serialis]KAH9914123.1 hypothetical protein B0H18DRAFT_150253 [Neoantrodia serialis]